MPALQISNDLGLPPPPSESSAQASSASRTDATSPSTYPVPTLTETTAAPNGLQTEFVFELPIGYTDGTGMLHKRGIMRLARTTDEIEPMSDPRVQANPAYATVIILSRVILSLGNLPGTGTAVIEGLFAGDLNYLQTFYRRINGLPQ